VNVPAGQSPRPQKVPSRLTTEQADHGLVPQYIEKLNPSGVMNQGKGQQLIESEGSKLNRWCQVIMRAMTRRSNASRVWGTIMSGTPPVRIRPMELVNRNKGLGYMPNPFFLFRNKSHQDRPGSIIFFKTWWSMVFPCPRVPSNPRKPCI